MRRTTLVHLYYPTAIQIHKVYKQTLTFEKIISGRSFKDRLVAASTTVSIQGLTIEHCIQ
ncbi:hypothetical protein Mapa_012859 [Marchantia paleacea]|nr:hypothetical protein Mapa_012859 [Marchantia paleacea]